MKKQLFALTLAGLILLPACVKEVESPSVTAARQAKAEQLASITALNNANAQAQLTLANAEAALKAAEAKAKEAEALKISAETELIKVQAELAAVEVEIAKVKLEKEKVALEIKKAELEAKLVELETLKAQAEVAKKQAAADLERLAIDIQTQLLKSQKALLMPARLTIRQHPSMTGRLPRITSMLALHFIRLRQILQTCRLILPRLRTILWISTRPRPRASLQTIKKLLS